MKLASIINEAKTVIDQRPIGTAHYAIYWFGHRFVFVPYEKYRSIEDDWGGGAGSKFRKEIDPTLEYGDIRAVVLADDTKQQLMLTDDVKEGQRRNRRESNTRKSSYAIYGGDDVFDGNIHRLQKFLSSLVVLDRKYLSYTLYSKANFNGFTVEHLLQQKDTISELTRSTSGSVMFYHGTSLLKYKQIQKTGLLPGMTRKAYSDQIKGYSDHNIYLSLDISDARNYATRAAIWDKSKAVVLQVEVNDFTKFVPDEDTMHWLDHILKGHRNAEPFIQRYMKDTGAEHHGHHLKHYKHEDSQFQSMLRIFATMQPKLAARNVNFAYRGRIQPTKIKLLESWKPAKMVHDPSLSQWEKGKSDTDLTYVKH